MPARVRGKSREARLDGEGALYDGNAKGLLGPGSPGRRRVRRVLARVALLLALVLVHAPAQAAAQRCSVCRRKVGRKYLTAGGKTLCSDRCYRKTLPQCSVCGKRISGKFVTAEGKKFCSSKCFETTLPVCEICGVRLRKAMTMEGRLYCEPHAKGPLCCGCGLPFRTGRELPDTRSICDACNERAVHDLDAASRLYAKAREEVRRVTGLRSNTLPRLELVGLDRMPEALRKLKQASVVQRGQYKRSTQTTTTKNLLGWKLKEKTNVEERVMILYALGPDEFMSTASHELTHDLLAEFFPQIPDVAPSWAEEGICQYVAATVCRGQGFKAQLKQIETSPHPEYGDGYRYFKRCFGDNNWRAISAWMRTTDLKQLPAAP